MASQKPPSFHCITKIKEAKLDYLPHGSLSSLNWAGVPGNDLLSHYPRIFGILITAMLWAGAGIKRALISVSRPLSVHLTFIFLHLFGCIPDPGTQTNQAQLTFPLHSNSSKSFLTNMLNFSLSIAHCMPAKAHSPIGKKITHEIFFSTDSNGAFRLSCLHEFSMNFNTEFYRGQIVWAILSMCILRICTLAV